MVEVGEGFTTIISKTSGDFITYFAPSGQTYKVTMVYAKDRSDGSPINDGIHVSPAVGTENSDEDGTIDGSSSGVPVVGANAHYPSSKHKSLQPIIVTDSDGLFLGKLGNFDAVVQGVRVA